MEGRPSKYCSELNSEWCMELSAPRGGHIPCRGWPKCLRTVATRWLSSDIGSSIIRGLYQHIIYYSPCFHLPYPSFQHQTASASSNKTLANKRVFGVLCKSSRPLSYPICSEFLGLAVPRDITSHHAQTSFCSLVSGSSAASLTQLSFTEAFLRSSFTFASTFHPKHDSSSVKSPLC